MIFFFVHLYVLFGEGNGNSLQYSCLENLTDKVTWQTMVHRVRESRTLLKRLSTSTMYSFSVTLFGTLSNDLKLLNWDNFLKYLKHICSLTELS